MDTSLGMIASAVFLVCSRYLQYVWKATRPVDKKLHIYTGTV